MTTFFLASDAVAIPSLEFVRTRVDKLIVVSQPDAPVGRGHKLTPNAVSAWALSHGVELWRPEKLDEKFMADLVAASPSLCLVMAYGRLLRQSFLDSFPLGVWNLHASELPRLRGASPVETAIALQLPQTAVALMRMVLALDAGPVADVIRVSINEQTTGPQLRMSLGLAAAAVVEKNFAALTAGTLATTPQDDSAATYCRILTKADTTLDFAAPAPVLAARVRAFAEWLGIAVTHQGERLKIYSATPTEKTSSAPAGTIIGLGEAIAVACGTGSLSITQLQKAGGKRLPAKEFLMGYSLKVGETLTGGALRPLEDTKPFPRGY